MTVPNGPHLPPVPGDRTPRRPGSLPYGVGGSRRLTITFREDISIANVTRWWGAWSTWAHANWQDTFVVKFTPQFNINIAISTILAPRQCLAMPASSSIAYDDFNDIYDDMNPSLYCLPILRDEIRVFVQCSSTARGHNLDFH